MAVGCEQEAEAWFEASLRICESKNMGPTVRVMALLPLARLAKTGKMPQTQMRNYEECLKQAARKLNPEYFEPLFREPFETFLDRMRICPERFFPFNYR